MARIVAIVIFVFANSAWAQNKPEPAHKTLVLTGCLENTTTPETFTLSSVSSAPRTAADQVPTSETTYELTPVRSVGQTGVRLKELQAYVGHMVEVTTHPNEQPPSLPTAASQSPTEALQPVDQQKRVRLIASQIKSLRPTCSP